MAKRRPKKANAIPLKNMTAGRQSVFDTDGVYKEPGIRYDLEPWEVKEFPEPIAKIFLENRKKYVCEYAPAENPRRHGEKNIWLANGTGNPLLPEKVTVVRHIKGERTLLEVENPLLEAVPIKRTMHGGFKVVPTEDGSDKQTWPEPNMVFEFPPFCRLPVSATYANWNLERDQRQEEQHQGKLRPCVPPRDFEPNNTWPLDRLQAYAHLLGNRDLLNRADLMGRDEWLYEDVEEMEEDRQRLAKALHFILLDDVEAPTEQDFEAAYAANWTPTQKEKRNAYLTQKKTEEAARKAAEKAAKEAVAASA